MNFLKKLKNLFIIKTLEEVDAQSYETGLANFQGVTPLAYFAVLLVLAIVYLIIR